MTSQKACCIELERVAILLHKAISNERASLLRITFALLKVSFTPTTKKTRHN